MTRTVIRRLLSLPLLLPAALLLGSCSDVTTVSLAVETVEIVGGGGIIYVNDSVQLTAVAKAGRFTLSGRTPIWNTSNPNVADVDASGRVTGKATGTVEITATIEQKSHTRTFQVQYPTPNLTALSHPAVLMGSQQFTMTVTGTGFLPVTVLRLNGTERPTTYISPTQVSTIVPAELLASPQVLQITAFNPAPGGGVSNALTFTVAAPEPTLTSIDPASVLAGSPDVTLTVNGTNFIEGTVVRVNGADRTTQYVNATRLTATIPASDIAAPGDLQITAFTPAPGGGASNALTLAVITAVNPVPVLTSLAPATFPDAGGRTIVVTGSDFVPNSVVRWNGSDRTTTYISSTQLRVTLDPADLATARTAQITVFNPAPGGGTSAQRPFTVYCPAATIPFPTTRNGSLTASACVGAASQRFDLYRFEVTSPVTVMVTMQSDQLDAALELYDGDFLDGSGAFFPIAFDDNAGGGTNARISHQLAPGEYYIAALGTPSGAQGSYTLTLSTAGGDAAAAEITNVGQVGRTGTGIGAAIAGLRTAVP